MSIDDLSSEELSVLAGLQAADPDAADRLAALDEASRARVVAHLGQVVPPRQVGSSPGEPMVSRSEPVVQVRSNRWGWLGWGLVSLAVVVLGVAGYTFYSRLAGDGTGTGPADDPVIIEDDTRTEPSGGAPPESDEDRPDPTESTIPDTASPAPTNPTNRTPPNPQHLTPPPPAPTNPTNRTPPNPQHLTPPPPAPTNPTNPTNRTPPNPQHLTPLHQAPTNLAIKAPLTLPPPCQPGYAHSCGLRPDRSLECWGTIPSDNSTCPPACSPRYQPGMHIRAGYG